MSLLVVGSVALDSVVTPFGESDETLGGSATYFSLAAGQFCDVRLVGVVGEDFPKKYVTWLQEAKIDTSGLETSPGKTFRWTGKYEGDMNTAETMSVDLNVFGEFDPKIPPGAHCKGARPPKELSQNCIHIIKPAKDGRPAER